MVSDTGVASGSVAIARFTHVAKQYVRQLLRPTEREAVPGGDPIGTDMRPFANQAAHELGWEEAVLRAQDEPGLNVGPCGEWPGSRHGSFRRVGAHSAHVLFGHGARHIVVVGDIRIIVAGKPTVACG